MPLLPLTPLALALLVPALLARAAAPVDKLSVARGLRENIKHSKLPRKVELPSGCLYDGRWHADGALVRTREACLRCACAHGALSCHRHACAPLPEPPPHCRLVRRRDECCPELHCSDGVKKLDQEVSARLDDLAVPESIGHVLPACVEGGTVYAAGSAMSSKIACEQCFCLGGARRCVTPRCLPPPEGCQAQPSSGACCPQRYYCQHIDVPPSHVTNPHDCRTEDGVWVAEGDRVISLGPGKECIQCFCLGGSIQCQSLSCAPKLKGCTPLVLPGQCCPHKYLCNDRGNDTIISNLYSKQDNLLVPLNENRSFHTSKSAKRETTIKAVSALASKKPTSPTTTNRPTMKTKSQTRNEENHTKTDLVITQPLNNTKEDENLNITTTQVPVIEEDITTKISSTVTDESTTADSSTESISTEQPERTIKIIINGTVNCTTELSSSTLILNTTNINESVWINSEIQPRIPFIDKDEIEAHTSLPNEIITNRVYDEEFDDNDSFTINVTSSLRTNTSSSVHTITTTTSTTSTTPRPKLVPPILVDGLNASKPKKDELEYDYNEPTLPPSLPNLKIIPFVAADAVVDDEMLPKENPSFTSIQQEDKFPVYYPGLETKEHAYPIRREDNYNPNEYPIFVTKKEENINSDNLNAENANTTNSQSAGMEKFTVATSLGNKIEAKAPLASIDNSRLSPSNQFSPPAETEGGFIPKSPGTIDEFYSIYSSTPPGPALPHLTTSMQIETKEDCISSNGQHIAEGVSINMGCSLCICAWGELHCSPRSCHSPPGCRWRSASINSLDLCCGELICDYESNTKATMMSTTDLIKQINDKNVIAKNNITTLGFTDNLHKEFEKETSGSKDFTVGNDTQGEMSTVLPIKSTTNVESSVNKTPMIINEDTLSNNSQSLEYEDDDDDEGFSLGSVLKLLLSENYDAKTTGTTLSPTKKTTIRLSDEQLVPSTPKIKTTTTSLYETPNEFIPMPPSIMPFKKLPISNPITRIDHLLLGESNAIRESTPRPLTTPIPTSTTRRPAKKTHQPYTSKPTTKKEIVTEPTDIQSVEISQPSHSSGFGLGLPKLAGCNIYGQMYRVGRIITELSTPCQECRCTEFGVNCTTLAC